MKSPLILFRSAFNLSWSPVLHVPIIVMDPLLFTMAKLSRLSPVSWARRGAIAITGAVGTIAANGLKLPSAGAGGAVAMTGPLGEMIANAGADGNAPMGATGKAPIGATGKAPIGATGKAPIGTAGKARMGAAGTVS